MIERLFAALLPSIEHFHLLGYWIALLAALMETALGVGLLLPGSTLLLLLGALAAKGYLDLGDLLWFAIVGAAIGDNVNYWLGQRYGNRWTRDGVGFLRPEHFDRARQFFNKHGAKSVFLGRFIPSVKEIAPFIAGTVGMRYRTFVLWNVLGAIGWGFQWVGAGYLFGQSLTLAEAWVSRVGLILAGIIAVWLLLWLVQRLLVRHGREVWNVASSLWRSIYQALRRNPYVRKWTHQHPRAVRFLAGRIEPSHFKGLPLTVLTLTFVYVLALFAGIVEDFVNSESIIAIDHATAQLVAAFRDPALIPAVVIITNLGSPVLVGALLAVTCTVLGLEKQLRNAIIGLLTSALGAAISLAVTKLTFHRARPYESVIEEYSFAFPSGHATMAMAFYGFLGYLLIRSAATWNAKAKLLIATAAIVSVLGLSRIVLGVHYLSDVWAGYLLGSLWLIAGISLNEWLAADSRIDWRQSADPAHKIVSWSLVTVAVLGSALYTVVHPLNVSPPPSEQTSQVDRPLIEVLRTELPARTTTLLGAPEQPLAFAIVTPDENVLISNLHQAGWLTADKPDFRNMVRLLRRDKSYLTAPLAPAFWNSRLNDLAFEHHVNEPQGETLATARLWRTSYRVKGAIVYVGTAREYSALSRGPFHRIAPDVDAAATRLIGSLEASGQLSKLCQRRLIAPEIGTFLMGAQFFTRGNVWLASLSHDLDSSVLCSKDAGPGDSGLAREALPAAQ